MTTYHSLLEPVSSFVQTDETCFEDIQKKSVYEKIDNPIRCKLIQMVFLILVGRTNEIYKKTKEISLF